MRLAEIKSIEEYQIAKTANFVDIVRIKTVLVLQDFQSSSETTAPNDIHIISQGYAFLTRTPNSTFHPPLSAPFLCEYSRVSKCWKMYFF